MRLEVPCFGMVTVGIVDWNLPLSVATLLGHHLTMY